MKVSELFPKAAPAYKVPNMYDMNELGKAIEAKKIVQRSVVMKNGSTGEIISVRNTMTKESIDLDEMTMRAGNLQQMAQSAIDLNRDELLSGKHIGDIDVSFKVLKGKDTYSIVKDDDLVASILLTKKFDLPVVENAWVKKEYRGKKWFSKLLWFMKVHEGMDKILIGDIHSSDMQEVVKNLSRFDKHWFDGKSVDNFSADTYKDYTGASKKTSWYLMLENDGDFSDWPRFENKGRSLKEWYDWQIE